MLNSAIHLFRKTLRPTIFGLASCLFCLALSVTALAQQRHALLVGVENYPGGEKARLVGCLLDVQLFGSTLLEKHSFARDNVFVATDAKATRAGILSALEQMLGRVKRGDLFVLYYTGHGTVFPDQDSELRDETQVITPVGSNGPLPTGRYDNALVPFDASQNTSGKPWGNLILDDELHVIFARFAAAGCNVVFVSDSCYSGSLARDLGDDDFQPKYLPPAQLPAQSTNRSARPALTELVAQDKAPDYQGRVLVFGSSSDTQPSIATKKGSLFTLALTEVLRSQPRISYQQLFQQVRTLVAQVSKGSQTPQLDARFFRGNLNEPFLSVPALSQTNAPSSQPTRQLKIVVGVIDVNNRPLPGAAIGLFPVGTATGKGQVRAETALFLGKSNAEGVFVSDKLLSPGPYRLKVVHPNHEKFEGDIEVIESSDVPGAALLLVRLRPER